MCFLLYKAEKKEMGAEAVEIRSTWEIVKGIDS